MSEDSDTPQARSRIQKPAQPSEDQIRQLNDLSRRDYFPALARLSLVPENRSRKAYTVVRDIYLRIADSWWSKLMDSVELSLSREERSKLVAEIKDEQKRMTEVELWLKPPEAPLSLDQALKFIKAAPSDAWQKTVMSRVGKRSRPGQPASKRRLALHALDIKCAYPHTSLSEATKLLCPCGRQKHLPQCRDQLRQQIIKLVKFLREHGHDFKWEHISTWKWEPTE